MARENLYFIDHYQKCGAMPLYLIFYKSMEGHKGHFAMLCSVKKLRSLLKQPRGFKHPEQYGRIIYKSYGGEPNEMLKGILKSRFYFDFDMARSNAGIL